MKTYNLSMALYTCHWYCTTIMTRYNFHSNPMSIIRVTKENKSNNKQHLYKSRLTRYMAGWEIIVNLKVEIGHSLI